MVNEYGCGKGSVPIMVSGHSSAETGETRKALRGEGADPAHIRTGYFMSKSTLCVT
jgi:hypothetical protein